MLGTEIKPECQNLLWFFFFKQTNTNLNKHRIKGSFLAYIIELVLVTSRADL